MKYLIKVLILFLLASCGSEINDSEDNKTEVQTDLRKMDYVLKAFTQKHIRLEENAFVRGNAAKELSKNVDSFMLRGYLSDIPLEIYYIHKNPHGDGAIVQFRTNNYDARQSSRLSDRLNFDVLAFANEKLAASLRENKKYLILGKKWRRLTRTETFLIVDMVYYSPETSIKKDTSYNNYSFNLGVFLCELVTVDPFMR